jgi:hypothetical protein
MAKYKDNLDPERLIEAAEASLLAAVETADDTGGLWLYPADLMGSPVQPECLAPFTKWEIQQACQFLVRLGILDRPQTKHAA